MAQMITRFLFVGNPPTTEFTDEKIVAKDKRDLALQIEDRVWEIARRIKCSLPVWATYDPETNTRREMIEDFTRYLDWCMFKAKVSACPKS